MKKFSILAVVLLTVSFAGAYVLEDITISETVGTGNATAYCVVDFDPTSTGDEYFFQFDFDSSVTTTGQDMLDALDGATTFEYSLNSYGMVGRLAYDGLDVSSQWIDGGIQSYWAYDLSSDGENWNYSSVGASDRVLEDGLWDSWTYTVVATPEPVSIALLGLGGLFLRKRK